MFILPEKQKNDGVLKPKIVYINYLCYIVRNLIKMFSRVPQFTNWAGPRENSQKFVNTEG